ncbi:MAG: hypothetical protein IJB74_08660 [Clostridia bacterium]|nr:hypothetical protein [Clostridia bacterium]
MKRIAVYLFLAVEGILYLLFLSGDIFSFGKPKVLKFIAVFLVAAFSIGAGKSKENRCVTAIFFFTVIADIFFLLLNKPLYGIGTYVIIQIIHTLRLSFISGKSIKTEILKRALPAVILFIIGLTLKGTGLALILSYGVFICINIAHCIENYSRNKSRNNLLYLTGMILLVIGDLGVGLRNLQPAFLSEQMMHTAYIITWITYLPSLLIIMSTTEAFLFEKKSK